MSPLRFTALASTFAAGLLLQGSVRALNDEVQPAKEPPATVDFERDVRPILDRCHPCHFPGGKKYADLPFDKPATVYELGEKLFSRIEDEKDRTVIRAFLAQKPNGSP